MCASKEYAAQHVCPERFKLIGEQCVTHAGGDDVVHDHDFLSKEIIIIKLYHLCRADSLVVAVFMHRKPVTRYSPDFVNVSPKSRQ